MELCDMVEFKQTGLFWNDVWEEHGLEWQFSNLQQQSFSPPAAYWPRELNKWRMPDPIAAQLGASTVACSEPDAGWPAKGQR